MEPTHFKTLTIGKQPAKKLSKFQQTFNRLSQRVEKLQDDIQKRTNTLNECLTFYGKSIHPLEQDMMILQKEIVKLLYKFYSSRNLALGDSKRRILREILCMHLDNILCCDKAESDEEIKKIYKNIFGVSYDAAVKEEFSDMMGEMKSMFENMGVDIDLSGIDIKAGPEEMARKMKEIERGIKEKIEAEEAREASKKKNKKQIAREINEQQIEDARNRSISSIYKQLAKAIHPDLEQDLAVKKEKEALMKQLTAAYENHDLHTLLRLEIQWIHKENSHLDTLTEEKLSIYNQLLKEQIREMECEKDMLIEHPKFFPLKNFSMRGFCLPSLRVLTSEKQKMEDTVGSLRNSIHMLKGANPIFEIKNMIDTFRRQDSETLDVSSFFR